MIISNWKWLSSIFAVIAWTVIVWLTALNYQSTKDDVKAKSIQILQLTNDKIILKKQLDDQIFKLNLSESTNKKIIEERDTVLLELNYANQNIVNHQNIINKLTPIDNSFVLFLKQSEATANAISNIGTIAYGNNENRECSASGILLYINAIREHDSNCGIKLNSCIDFYNTLRNKSLSVE